MAKLSIQSVLRKVITIADDSQNENFEKPFADVTKLFWAQLTQFQLIKSEIGFASSSSASFFFLFLTITIIIVIIVWCLASYTVSIDILCCAWLFSNFPKSSCWYRIFVYDRNFCLCERCVISGSIRSNVRQSNDNPLSNFRPRHSFLDRVLKDVASVKLFASLKLNYSSAAFKTFFAEKKNQSVAFVGPIRSKVTTVVWLEKLNTKFREFSFDRPICMQIFVQIVKTNSTSRLLSGIKKNEIT